MFDFLQNIGTSHFLLRGKSINRKVGGVFFMFSIVLAKAPQASSQVQKQQLSSGYPVSELPEFSVKATLAFHS